MKYALTYAWIIALLGFAVSVYYGEILWIEPCRLCWYQRIALFPLALLLGIGAYRDDKQIALYTLPLSIFGALAAIYQSLSIHVPSFQGCGEGCAKPIFSLFGFLTFADLSAIGFILISLLLIHVIRK
jgi:disulfide bond formation protein DsbB